VKLSQVRLLVDDFGGCFRFLRDDLGLHCTFGDEGSGYASFTAGEGTIAVFDRAEQAEVATLRPAGDAALVVLEVEDTDAAVERLAPRVVAGPVDRTDWGGRVAYVRDPDGNLFELFQSIPMEEE
jgi:catechol 2,3-dioxygenase-like lactoylglutathione lyase family enzyme